MMKKKPSVLLAAMLAAAVICTGLTGCGRGAPKNAGRGLDKAAPTCYNNGAPYAGLAHPVERLLPKQ